MKTSASTKGFTLVEIVVAFALSAILFTALFMTIAPIYRLYRRTLNHADGQILAGNIVDTIRTASAGAQELTANDAQVLVGRRNVYEVNGGRLYYNQKPVFDEKYYADKNIFMQTRQLGENIVLVTIQVSGDDMLPAEVSAVISPLRRIVEEGGDAQTSGAVNNAHQTIQENPSHTADELFQDLYVSEGGVNTGFPAYSVNKIFPAAQLQALVENAQASGSDADRALMNTLSNSANSFYLATYFTTGTQESLLYLTNVASADSNSGNAAFCVYYDGNWYVRNPNIVGNQCLNLFDGLVKSEISNLLNEGYNFTLAANYVIPSILPVTP